MTASYRAIDYSLRPAKFVERKMFCELFSRLQPFGSLDSYRYVGFGSIWFADCVLFHRSLGIKEIVSIEQVIEHEKRFQFNCPLLCIELRMAEAAKVLPELEWSRHNIIWLDYDDILTPSILDDVRTCASRIQSGSVLAVTVQSNSFTNKNDSHRESKEISTSEQFVDLFGIERTPPGLKTADFRGWNISKTSRRVIASEIQAALDRANVVRPIESKLSFKQICAFEYEDGAKMTTIIAVFFDTGQSNLLAECGFEAFPYCRGDEKAYRIKVPLLTPYEMSTLDRNPSVSDNKQSDFGFIPESDAKNYTELYRYLPNFVPSER